MEHLREMIKRLFGDHRAAKSLVTYKDKLEAFGKFAKDVKGANKRPESWNAAYKTDNKDVLTK